MGSGAKVGSTKVASVGLGDCGADGGSSLVGFSGRRASDGWAVVCFHGDESLW